MMRIYAYRGDRCVYDAEPSLSPGETQSMLRAALLEALIDCPPEAVVTIRVADPEVVEVY